MKQIKDQFYHKLFLDSKNFYHGDKTIKLFSDYESTGINIWSVLK